jgi:hypothetical protein
VEFDKLYKKSNSLKIQRGWYTMAIKYDTSAAEKQGRKANQAEIDILEFQHSNGNGNPQNKLRQINWVPDGPLSRFKPTPKLMEMYQEISDNYVTTIDAVQTVDLYLAGSKFGLDHVLKTWTEIGGNVDELLEVASTGVNPDDLMYAVERIPDSKHVQELSDLYGNQNGTASGDVSFFPRLVDAVYLLGEDETFNLANVVKLGAREVLFSDLSDAAHQELQFGGYDNPRLADSTGSEGFTRWSSQHDISTHVEKTGKPGTWTSEPEAEDFFGLHRMQRGISFRKEQNY